MEELEEKIRLYKWKNEYLQRVEYYRQIGLKDFMELIFMRTGKEEFIFEERMCEEYVRWRDHPEAQYKEGQPFCYNPLVVCKEIRKRDDGERYQVIQNKLIFKDDDECLNSFKGRDFAIMSPITYVGKVASYKNARFAFAMAFDLDGVGENQLVDLFHQIRHKDKDVQLPRPNIIVNSGNGLHLYYIFEKPIAMYEKHVKLLNRLKHVLTTYIWNSYTSSLEKRQSQGIVQSFRLPGSKTKFGEDVVAFYDEEVELWTIRELNEIAINHHSKFALNDNEVNILDKSKAAPSRLTLAGAKGKYPEWYEKVIVRGDKSKKKWNIKPALYKWWLRMIVYNEQNYLKQGCRYHCLLILVNFAVKCNVPYEEVKKDVLGLVSYLDRFTTSADGAFTEFDAYSALKSYDGEFKSYSKHFIEAKTGFKPKEGRRNYRKQKLHLKLARNNRDTLNENWREGNGRKSQKEVVLNWRKLNPDGKKAQCIKDTGLSKPTVYKWWDAE